MIYVRHIICISGFPVTRSTLIPPDLTLNTVSRVTLNVMTANDNSLLGLKIENSEFISMSYLEFLDLVQKIRGKEETNVVHYSI